MSENITNGVIEKIRKDRKGVCCAAVEGKHREPDDGRAQSGQHVASALEVFCRLEYQDDAEHQHGHGVGSQVHFQAKAGNQPGSCCRTQVGTENDANAGHQVQQARAEERNRNDGNQRA